MKEFLRTKGFKMTPQREVIFRSFFELGKHITVDELYEKVRERDHSVGYATVWRNLKLICKVGLAEEVNLGDSVTRYDRITREPHGHLYCLVCKQLIEFNSEKIVGALEKISKDRGFQPDGFKIEIQGVCDQCRAKTTEAPDAKTHVH